MAIKSFEVSDVYELRVMQRIFREAKFCTVADDDEISDSPIVASLFSRLMAALIEAEVAVGGENVRQSWDRWLIMDNPLRQEWTSARKRAQENQMWHTMTEPEKLAYIELLFSPFMLPDNAKKQFLTEVNNLNTANNREELKPDYD
jgi:hypothetical protein